MGDNHYKEKAVISSHLIVTVVFSTIIYLATGAKDLLNAIAGGLTAASVLLPFYLMTGSVIVQLALCLFFFMPAKLFCQLFSEIVSLVIAIGSIIYFLRCVSILVFGSKMAGAKRIEAGEATRENVVAEACP